MSGFKEVQPHPCDTFGSKWPENLPCHVGVVREADGFRAWVWFAGTSFAIADSCQEHETALNRALPFSRSPELQRSECVGVGGPGTYP